MCVTTKIKGAMNVREKWDGQEEELEWGDGGMELI